MGYSKSFFTGLTWNGGAKIASKALTAIKLAVLARLLTPTEFGLFSLVLVSVSLVEVFTETGINTILVQSKQKLQDLVDIAWIFSIARGLVITTIVIAMAFIMPVIFDEPRLTFLILLSAVIPLIRSFINPAIIHFYKQLQFGRDSLYRLSLVAAEVISAIGIGLVIRSATALVLSLVVAAIADVILSFTLVRLRPKLRFVWSEFKELYQQSNWLNKISILDYLNKNADDLIIGRLLGTAVLGLYRNAYQLTHTLTAEMSLSVLHASFPIFTRLQDDLPRLKRAFIRTYVLTAGLFLIPLLGLLLFPELAVRIVLGEQWLAIIPIIPYLAMAGYLQALINIVAPLLTSQKKYQQIVSYLSITLLVMVAGMMMFIPEHQLMAAAGAVLGSRVVTLPVALYFTRQSLANRENL